MLTEIYVVSGEEQNPFQHNESKRRRAIKVTRTLVLNLWCRMILFPVLPATLPVNSPEAGMLQLKQSTILPAALFHLEFLPVRSSVHSPRDVGLEEGSMWRLKLDFLVCQESHRKYFKLQMGCVFSDLKVQLCIEDDLEK